MIRTAKDQILWNSRGKWCRPTYTGEESILRLFSKSMIFKLRQCVWEGAEGIAFCNENGVCKDPEVLPKIG